MVDNKLYEKLKNARDVELELLLANVEQRDFDTRYFVTENRVLTVFEKSQKRRKTENQRQTQKMITDTNNPQGGLEPGEINFQMITI